MASELLAQTFSDPHRVRNRCQQRLDSRRCSAGRGGSMPEVTLLQQVERTQLHGHQVQHSDTQHVVIIDGVVVPCTPTEYGLLVPLLYYAGEAVRYTHLLGMRDRKSVV